MNSFFNIPDEIEKYDSNSKKSIAERILEKNDTIILWNINQVCNFSCSYCNLNKSISLLSDRYLSKEIVNYMDKINKRILFLITGGEPFLYKDFINLIHLLSQKHFININTNLYHESIYEFAEKISPKRITGLHVSIHYNERKKYINGFSDLYKKYSFLRRKGFNIFCSYVAHPDDLDKIENHISELKREGIDKITPKLFIGYHKGKLYPAAYTISEIQSLKLLKNVTVDVDFCSPLYNYNKRFCNSGYNYYYMEPDGLLKRCMSSEKILGKIYEPNKIQLPKENFCNIKQHKCFFECVLLSSAIKKKKNFLEKIYFSNG